MIINIQNFGPFNKSKIEIKPLTVFIGPNGTGKTWTATLAASLFSPSMWRYYFKAYSKNKLTERYEIIEDAIEQLLINGNTKINIEQFFEDYGHEYLNNVARLLPEYLPKLLGSEKLSFEKLNVSVEFDSEKYVPNLIKSSLNKKMGEDKDGEAILELYTQKEDPNIYIITRSNKEIREMPEFLIRRKISSFVFRMIHQSFFNETYFFPAERTGMIQFISVIKSAPDEESQSNEMESKNRNEQNLSLSLQDLVITISRSCDSDNQNRRQQLAKKNPKIRKYIELSHILENDVLGGGVEIDEKTDKSIEILFKHNNVDEIFDIPPVSSSIKDLIGLVLYLRYIAKENDLIVIDEPEMNLHPEAQIKVMEFISMMVNCGLNLIITTHSPYLVDHISNLTKAHKLKKNGKENLEDKFKLKDKLCFIDSEKVTVSLFDNNVVKNIFDGDLIDWDTFGNVSDYVSNLYFEL